jgi:hypothetical protein
VRPILTFILATLLTLCPVLCGGEEFGLGAYLHGTSDAPSHAPGNCPEQGDDCICRGAVQASNVRVPDADADAVGLPMLLDILPHTPLHPLSRLTWGGSPTGLAGWGDTLSVRSFLQNFRC